MANLRIVSVVAVDSTDITAVFSEALNENINVQNIVLNSQTPGVPDPQVLIVNVSGTSLSIITQPLTPLAAYFITFQSTSTILFNSINGDAVLPNDGVSNRQLILGPTSSDNPVQQYLINFLRGNVYNLDSPSVISNYIQSLSNVLSKSLYAIRQAKNENYLSFTIKDEVKTRGPGPFDRLNEEGAYEVLRVGKTQTGANLNAINQVSPFPSYLVSLLATNNSETLTVSSLDRTGVFNLNSFVLNLSKINIIKLVNVIFVYQATSYTYDVSKFGYQILDSRYDPDFAFTYLQLSSNQIKLNQQILQDPNFSTNNIVNIQVSYQYKDTGKIIDQTSLIVDTILPSGLETIPPIENIFTLKNAPIVVSSTSDTIGGIGSVSFIDPNALPGSNQAHPAFLYEVPFRLDYLPSVPGEYSVDYNTGNVYVFGVDSGRTGTGPFPPIATYFYRQVFKSEVDYVYDPDTSDLAPLPNGSLIGSAANISYNYEEVLVQGVDYKADAHIEVLSESVENRLIALNVIQPVNFPVTDVFRIFNQTSGEIYSILRWTDNKIFFGYNKAPNIVSTTGERASFQNVLNEVLFVSSVIPISISENVFKIFFNDNNIIAASEDCIGSFINSTVKFSNSNIFIQERYFDDNLTESVNISKLQNIGDYLVDYVNGVAWCLVPSSQSYSIGTVSYKRGYIAPENPHVISVEDIYYQSSVLAQKTKHFSYRTFSDGSILPSSFDVSNEEFLMNNTALPYQLHNNQVGAFVNAIFTPGISNSVNFIRGLFEYDDLSNSVSPVNFAASTTFNGTNVSVAPLLFSEYHSVQFDGTNYYVFANTNLPYLSPNINISLNIRRLTDSAQLSGSVMAGSPFKVILSGANSPAVGNPVLLTYSFTINDLSRVVIDYDKGGFYVDYTYLADEIIISYEYGDNVLDFRQSLALNQGDNYYVTYKAGALRDALLKNFGTLINLPILNSLDVSFERERYRDALMAAMQSFPLGPTVASISNIVNTIVHTPPEIIESAFQNWSLGNSLLNPEAISTTGNFSLVPAKYGNGVLVNSEGQTISFPTVSNLRLEQGSLEGWINPNWNGIDNQTDLSISILKNGLPLEPENIFIGPSAFHPLINDENMFIINKQDRVLGIPNESKDGIFIYYAPDISGAFDRWYIDVLDGYADGYVNNVFNPLTPKNYTITIKTHGKFYDVKSTLIPQPSSDKIFSGTGSLKYTIIEDGYVAQGITFVADHHHFIFDFGKEEGQNRFSLFKDESGYLNFRVIDNDRRIYNISADVSSWKAGQLHHVATSWSLATKNRRDEMHLFVDGFEVPNIIKYGNKVSPYLHEKYRTIDPEEIVGVINSSIVASNDLVVTFGSNTVTSSLNFSAYGIISGGTLYIEEPGFSSFGYTILTVNGNTLTLSTTMPLSTTNASFSVNKTTFNVSTEIDLYPNIAVSLLHSSLSGADLIVNSGLQIVNSPSTNFSTNGVRPGYFIRINEPGFANYYTILAVSGNFLTIDSPAPASFGAAPFYIYPNSPQEIPGVRALSPAYEISRAGDIVSLSIRDKASANDIVLINTLGLNIRLIKQKYYVWGGTSNIIMTRLPTPVLLSDVNINHIILDGYAIGPTNSTLISGVFNSGQIAADQPSLSDTGRTLSVYISGTNVDYTTPVSVTINGTVSNISNQNLTLTFNENTTLNTSVKFQLVNYITVNCKPIDPTKNCVVIAIKELYPITTAENSTIVAAIRYSYQMLVGNALTGSGNTVSDANGFFYSQTIGNRLVITSPPLAAGQYTITSVSGDHKSATVSPSLPGTIVSGGIYEVLNISTFNSGLQNGFFTFENASTPGQPYTLVQGGYEFEYYTYLSVPISLDKTKCFIGTDINGENIFNGVIDEVQIVSERLTDTRVGETALVNQETITKDFNSLKALKSSQNTLVLLHLDSFPFTNDASIYTTSSSQFIQSSSSVNDNFGKSIYITNTPVMVNNTGILDTKKQGTIEFWVSPIFDTNNDPNYRFYFDAFSAINQKTISVNNATVKVSGRISKILSVKLQVGNQNIDYFAGGEIDPDGQTIYLNKALPNQQTPVVVNYIPNGTEGDRISIYKDPFGYVNFTVSASGVDYQVRSPIFWTKNTWHRVKASYIFNSGAGTDEIRLFVDGYENGSISYGNGLLFGQGQVYGSFFVGEGLLNQTISFKDTMNELFIGSEFDGTSGAFARIDNFRISNLSRPIFRPFGESIDVNYSPNLNIVIPVVDDLYTTLLLDFNSLTEKNTNFSTLKNRLVGLSDFTVNIFDEFDIVGSSATVKQVLEELINTLKPANSRVFLTYTS